MSLRTVIMAVGVGLMVLNGSVKAVEPPVAGEGWDWSGVFFGFHAGYGFGDASVKIGEGEGADALIAQWQEMGAVPERLDTDPDGFMGGIQFGINQQRDHLVLGLEADFSYSNVRGADSERLEPVAGADVTTRARQELQYFSTARVRAGVAHERMLFYVTGGLAYGRAEYSAGIREALIADLTGDDVMRGSNRKRLTGWTVGGGIEFALAERISLKGEYLYYDLGSETLTLSERSDFFPGEATTTDFDFSGHIVRAGVNVHF